MPILGAITGRRAAEFTDSAMVSNHKGTHASGDQKQADAGAASHRPSRRRGNDVPNGGVAA